MKCEGLGKHSLGTCDEQDRPDEREHYGNGESIVPNETIQSIEAFIAAPLEPGQRSDGLVAHEIPPPFTRYQSPAIVHTPPTIALIHGNHQ